jgi:hypothetical protein
MTEYNVSFIATQDGALLLDIPSSTGTSRMAMFQSPEQVCKFFSSLGIHDHRVAEVKNICSELKPGYAYHEQMFLPDTVVDTVNALIDESDGKTGELVEALARNPESLCA